MTDTYWVISDRSGGFRQVATGGNHPRDAGEDVQGKTVKQMVRQGRLDCERPNLNTGEWSLELDALREAAMARIDDEREQQQLEHLTPGAAKSFVYAQKAIEVEMMRIAGVDAVDAIAAEDLAAAGYPAAAAQAVLTGDRASEIIEQFAAGAAAARAAVMRIEALAQASKAAVRRAETIKAVEAAAVVDWGLE